MALEAGRILVVGTEHLVVVRIAGVAAADTHQAEADRIQVVGKPAGRTLVAVPADQEQARRHICGS
jgi:hypothetical protein